MIEKGHERWKATFNIWAVHNFFGNVVEVNYVIYPHFVNLNRACVCYARVKLVN